MRGRSPRRIFPSKLALGDGRDVGIAGVALVLLDKVAHVLTDDHAAKALLDACSQPAFTAGLGASENQDLHE